MNQSPKILLLGDYSNCHQSLAHGLRHIGCEVTVASDGGRWMNFDCDIKISRRSGKIGGLIHYIELKHLLKNRLSGFDIVAINDLNFTRLRPRLLRRLLNVLKSHNKLLFLTAMSDDITYHAMLSKENSPLRYSEWYVDGKPSRHHMANTDQWKNWHNTALIDYQKYAFDNIDGAVSALYEYHLGIESYLGKAKTAYGGIPIVMERFPQIELPENPKKIKLFLGRDRTRLLFKGTDLLETAARTIVERYPDKAELTIVENRPFDEFVELMKSSHIVLDQIYSYTPATTALMAMAYGLNVVSGAEPEYYDFIGERDNKPIINAPIEIEGLIHTLEQIVLNPHLIRERGLRSREFVEKHNDSKVVAKRYLDFWNERRAAKS